MDSKTVTVRFLAPNETHAVYSDRIPWSEWDIHTTDIVRMHSGGLTKTLILRKLETKGFLPSLKQLRLKMEQMGLRAENRGDCSLEAQSFGYTADQRPMRRIDDLCIDLEIDIAAASEEETFAARPAPFGWSSFAGHSPPNCEENATRAPSSVHSDQVSIVSRQTFATHPSDDSSTKIFRQECRRINEIPKVDLYNGRQCMAETKPPGLPEHQFAPDFKRMRFHSKYQCHFCGYISTKPKGQDARCNRCSHQRCGACQDWPQASQSSSDSRIDSLGMTPCYSMSEEDSPESDVEALFGIGPAKGACYEASPSGWGV